ncbi:LPXTG-motif cell wall anchor domain protein [Elysia marginata]|uniref:LPXTG-motif cell wall anchor domain protein n=1 Tax=Elysia marginata TaxID=1093978 RepID=A0AAV4JER6_9GAST|nr:LPXTG-motif cell wall anchor domain protein [Elysia marginata]
MLFHLDRRPVIFGRQVLPCQLLTVIVVCLLVRVPSSTAKLFKASSDDGRHVMALVDVQFTLRLTAHKDGQQVGFKELTENDIFYTQFEYNKLPMKLKLAFNEVFREYGFFTLRMFHNLDNTVSLGLDFDLCPDRMFKKVHSELDQVTFGAFGYKHPNIGDASKSFLCNRTEKIILRKTSVKSDSYKYSVNLETKYFHFQAFTVEDGNFSPEPPTSCEGRDPTPEPSRDPSRDPSPEPSRDPSRDPSQDPSPEPTRESGPGDSNPSIIIVAGSVGGCIVLLALIGLVVMLVVRYRRQHLGLLTTTYVTQIISN